MKTSIESATALTLCFMMFALGLSVETNEKVRSIAKVCFVLTMFAIWIFFI